MSRNERALEGLRDERVALVHRYTVAAPEGDEGSREAAAQGAERDRRSPPVPTRIEYLIEVQPVWRLLWRWSLFELIELHGDKTQPPLPGRSPEPIAKSRTPCLSRQAAIRAAESEARAISERATEAVAGRPPPAAKHSRASSRMILPVVLVLFAAAALVAGTIVATRGNSRHPRTAPLTPPGKSRSGVRPHGHRISARRAALLDEEGYSRMRSGNYAAALPLLERAVGRLRGTRSLTEAYAEFNLADTRYQLGKCSSVIALLDRSERIQGSRVAIDNLRRDARRTCR